MIIITVPDKKQKKLLKLDSLIEDVELSIHKNYHQDWGRNIWKKMYVIKAAAKFDQFQFMATTYVKRYNMNVSIHIPEL